MSIPAAWIARRIFPQPEDVLITKTFLEQILKLEEFLCHRLCRIVVNHRKKASNVISSIRVSA